MQVFRKNNNDISGCDVIVRQVYKNCARSLLNDDKFCFFMPVNRYFRKIIRYSAQISVIRKLIFRMTFFFVVLFWFWLFHAGLLSVFDRIVL